MGYTCSVAYACRYVQCVLGHEYSVIRVGTEVPVQKVVHTAVYQQSLWACTKLAEAEEHFLLRGVTTLCRQMDYVCPRNVPFCNISTAAGGAPEGQTFPLHLCSPALWLFPSFSLPLHPPFQFVPCLSLGSCSSLLTH